MRLRCIELERIRINRPRHHLHYQGSFTLHYARVEICAEFFTQRTPQGVARKKTSNKFPHARHCSWPRRRSSLTYFAYLRGHARMLTALIPTAVSVNGPVFLLHFAWVVDDAKCIVVTRVCVSVCVSVCLSAAVCSHYCTDPDETWGVAGAAP